MRDDDRDKGLSSEEMLREARESLDPELAPLDLGPTASAGPSHANDVPEEFVACPGCGQLIAETNAFCTLCGESLPVVQTGLRTETTARDQGLSSSEMVGEAGGNLLGAAPATPTPDLSPPEVTRCASCGRELGESLARCPSCGEGEDPPQTGTAGIAADDAASETPTTPHIDGRAAKPAPAPPLLPPPPLGTSSTQTRPWYKQSWVRVLGVFLVLGGIGWFRSTSAPPSGDDFVDEMRAEFLDAGVTSDGWECIERNLRRGGYVDDIDSLSAADWRRLRSESVGFGTPLTDVPPEFRRFLEGLMIYVLDPNRGCLSPHEVQAVVNDESQLDDAPMAYGSSSQLDSLYDGCAAGVFADCDMAFIASPPGSEYEAFATSCGGRNEPLDFNATFCQQHHDDFIELADLRSQCESGFFPACDLLGAVSEVGSDEEVAAETCGGRREAQTAIPCAADFGIGNRQPSHDVPALTTTTEIQEPGLSTPGAEQSITLEPDGWVTDQAGVLTDDTWLEIAVDRVVEQFGNEIAVVIVETSGGLDPREYGTRLFNTWGIGDPVRNDGVLILIALEQQRTEIIVGSGLPSEGVSEVAAAGDSFFGAGDFEGGLFEIIGALRTWLADLHG